MNGAGCVAPAAQPMAHGGESMPDTRNFSRLRRRAVAKAAWERAYSFGDVAMALSITKPAAIQYVELNGWCLPRLTDLRFRVAVRLSAGEDPGAVSHNTIRLARLVIKRRDELADQLEARAAILRTMNDAYQ